ncbi:MAG TPA: MFS transporter [Patescibacteria group bacterium]|jgi:MFS family permease
MLKQALHRLLRRRHFWRNVGFDELSEIYVSTMFRSLALSLTNIFVPLYMLKQGFSIVEVMILATWYFVFRAVIFDLLTGWLVARVGPKHTIICSYWMLALSAVLFLTVPQMGWPIWLLGGIWGGASSLFCIPFSVDFSKIKHKDHGGKELGYANVMEKAGGVLGPLVGGMVATFFGGQYIFLAGIFMLVVGAWPLLRTAEPIPTRQPFRPWSLPWRRIKHDLISFVPYSMELTWCGFLWPLYLGVFVLTGAAAYAGLGLLASVSVVASIVAALTIGRLVDKHRGRLLLRFGATSNAILHLFRPFVTLYPTALLVNLANEAMTVSYHLPYRKGMYDRGDDIANRRIEYFAVMEFVGSIVKALGWVGLVLLTYVMPDTTVVKLGFVFAAISSLLIMTERFPALKARRV